MESGDLKHKVDYYEPSTLSTSASGVKSRGETKLWSSRAALWTLKGEEAVRQKQIHPQATHWVTIRYCADEYPKPKGKFKFANRRGVIQIFDIIHVDNIAFDDKWVRCLVSEQVQN